MMTKKSRCEKRDIQKLSHVNSGLTNTWLPWPYKLNEKISNFVQFKIRWAVIGFFSLRSLWTL